jgi:hypothetical protein
MIHPAVLRVHFLDELVTLFCSLGHFRLYSSCPFNYTLLHSPFPPPSLFHFWSAPRRKKETNVIMELPGMTESLLGEEEPDDQEKRFQPVVNLEYVNNSLTRWRWRWPFFHHHRVNILLLLLVLFLFCTVCSSSRCTSIITIRDCPVSSSLK